MTGQPKIVLDCDPGVDDMFAIFTAVRLTELVAITTVAGNVGIEHTTANALGIVELCGTDVPVHRGAAGPLVGVARDARDVHGETGLGGAALPTTVRELASHDAAAALLDATSDGDVAVVAVGPLTNLAHALERDPSWPQRVPRLVLMGGSSTSGNVTAAAEFNIWADPEAAAVVFASGFDLTMVGLNLTRQVRMGPPEIERLRATESPTARFAADALESYADHSLRSYGVPKTAMHDPCAVLEVVRSDLFRRARYNVVVETEGTHTRGMTLCDQRPNAAEPNASVLTEADAGAIVELIIDATVAPVPGI